MIVPNAWLPGSPNSSTRVRVRVRVGARVRVSVRVSVSVRVRFRVSVREGRVGAVLHEVQGEVANAGGEG